jgi:hypothetical protein
MKEMIFKFGFEYKNVRYGWKDKQLYRLPFSREKRSYGLKLILMHEVKKTKCWNVCRIKKTKEQLKLLTKKVDWKIEVLRDKSLPF